MQLAITVYKIVKVEHDKDDCSNIPILVLTYFIFLLLLLQWTPLNAITDNVIIQ